LENEKIMSESCQECAYFESKECMDKVAFTAKLNGPSAGGCSEFEPKNNQKTSKNTFCIDCIHFENMLGWTICSRAHKHGIACPAFKRKAAEEKLELLQV
jgi:hypothetical protein